MEQNINSEVVLKPRGICKVAGFSMSTVYDHGKPVSILEIRGDNIDEIVEIQILGYPPSSSSPTGLHFTDYKPILDLDKQNRIGRIIEETYHFKKGEGKIFFLKYASPDYHSAMVFRLGHQ